MNGQGDNKHNSTFNFDEFDISDASISIPAIPRFSDHGSPVNSTPYNYNAGHNNNRQTGLTFPRLNQNNQDNGVKTAPVGFDSKLDASDFAISESDRDKNAQRAHKSPARASNENNNNSFGGLSNILSPQIPASEVKRHFNDFSSAFHSMPDSSPMYDRSIEVGRSSNKGRHQADFTFSPMGSSRGDSPMARKVTDKPGSATGFRPTTSQDFFSKRPNSKNKTDSVSSNEKVTSSSSSPNFQTKETKSAFKIPTGYDNDASFFEKLGVKKKPVSATTKKQLTSSETDGVTSKGKADDPITLPDISGISSIFSSEESSRPNRRNDKVQHKTLLSVPLDPDEKGEYYFSIYI